MERVTGILGLAASVFIVYLLSRERRSVRWRVVAWGIVMQLLLAILLLQVPWVKEGFAAFAAVIAHVLSFADHGAAYLFGSLVDGRLPLVTENDEEASRGFIHLGTILMLKILPTIIFVSSGMAVLYHLGILQRIVSALAWVMTKTLRVSAAEALAAAANVFMGQAEAPLVVRPYLSRMTSSEIFAVMAGGFATISGSMMAIYHSLFQVDFELLLAASLLNAPAALYLTKVYLPETGEPSTLGGAEIHFERDTANVVDAAASGASTGLSLALNVGAMLLAFSALLKLFDAFLGWIGSFMGVELTLGTILGWLFWPFAWTLGVPASEAAGVGELLGTKIALNEYFAYGKLATLELSERSQVIATFALCGFANFGSIAIQLGCLGGIVPERRKELARVGVPAMFVGALASFNSAALAGIVIGG